MFLKSRCSWFECPHCTCVLTGNYRATINSHLKALACIIMYGVLIWLISRIAKKKHFKMSYNTVG